MKNGECMYWAFWQWLIADEKSFLNWKALAETNTIQDLALLLKNTYLMKFVTFLQVTVYSLTYCCFQSMRLILLKLLRNWKIKFLLKYKGGSELHERRYNGWSNYQTWVTFTRLANDENTYFYGRIKLITSQALTLLLSLKMSLKKKFTKFSKRLFILRFVT